MTAQSNQMSLAFGGPQPSDLFEAAREAAKGCKACHLWEPATQTIFGEGPVPASIMLIGEQPGDKEDLAGRPFVGPAGLKLDEALIDAGIDRRKLYVTNAVKHFKYVPRGRIRLHQKPVTVEIKACRPWLERELDFVARQDLPSPWAQRLRKRSSARRCQSIKTAGRPSTWDRTRP
jgi:DNA polymerase